MATSSVPVGSVNVQNIGHGPPAVNLAPGKKRGLVWAIAEMDCIAPRHTHNGWPAPGPENGLHCAATHTQLVWPGACPPPWKQAGREVWPYGARTYGPARHPPRRAAGRLHRAGGDRLGSGWGQTLTG